MINVSLKISIPDEKSTDFLETMDFLHSQTCSYPGCVSCHVYKDTRHEDTFFVVEEWETSEALARYIRSSIYGKVLSVMELSAEVPEIKFSSIAGERGMDLIEELRI